MNADTINDAKPAEFLNKGPFRAELFNEKTGWAGVMNAQGVNCLTFKSKPGAVVAEFETCKIIAEKWNASSQIAQ